MTMRGGRRTAPSPVTNPGCARPIWTRVYSSETVIRAPPSDVSRFLRWSGTWTGSSAERPMSRSPHGRCAYGLSAIATLLLNARSR